MSLFDLVFGCSHQRCSFPITVKGKLRRSVAASVTGTYVVCLDCGREFPYDWKEMKLVRTTQTSAAPQAISVPSGSKAA
jgi:predicted transcriptional regulator